MTIYSCISGKTFDEIEKEFDGIGYKEFKTAVGECVVEHLIPIQNKYKEFIADKAFLEKCYKESAQKALYISNKTLNKVMKKVGFVL